MAHFERKLLLSFLITTILSCTCEGFYSYNGTRYSYGCTGWIGMGTTIYWQFGLGLREEFVAYSYACESDTCADNGNFCKPPSCEKPCDFFCDLEKVYYHLQILDNGTVVNEKDAECKSFVCASPSNGTGTILCTNYNLRPDAEKKYVLHLTVDIQPENDDKPSRNQDSDLYIIAGEVDPGKCTGSWENGSLIIAGEQGHFIIQLMDSFNNNVSSKTGRSGTDLDVRFRASIAPDDTNGTSDIIVGRNGDMGTYDVSFMVSTAGYYNLIVEAIINFTTQETVNIRGSPFSFKVIPGLPSATKSRGAWLNGTDKFTVGENVTFVIYLIDSFGNNVTTDARGGSRLNSFSWDVSVIDQNATAENTTFPVSLGTPTDEGTQSITFSPTEGGTYELIIYKIVDIQGSPFIFNVRKGNPVMSSSTAIWLNTTSSAPQVVAGSYLTMEVTQRDADNNSYIYAFPFTLKVVATAATAAQRTTPFRISNPVNDLKMEEGPNLSEGKVTVTFEAIASGQFQLHIGNGTREIFGSPFTFSVLPGPLVVENTTGGWSTDSTAFELGNRVLFMITQRDAYGNPATQDKNNVAAGTAYFSAKVFREGENDTEVQFSDLTIRPVEDPIWTQERLEFTITKVGKFEMAIYASATPFMLAKHWYYFEEAQGTPIMGSPFHFSAVVGDIDVSACNASGPGLSGGAAGDTLHFNIYTYDEHLEPSLVWASSFTIEFYPAVYASPVLREGAGNAIEVEYRITVASGPAGYAMTVKSSNSSEEIDGSPFRVIITPGPLSIRDCSGHFRGGTPAIPINTMAVFVIEQQDAFGNKFYTENSWDAHNYTVRILHGHDNNDPATVVITLTLSVSDKDQMLVMFNLNVAETYILEVGDSSGSIRGSPFTFSVVRGPVITADQCRAQFVPDKDLEVGMSMNIIITSYDTAGQPTKSDHVLTFRVRSVPPMLGTTNPIVPNDMNNGTYVATIIIKSPGLFTFLIDLYGAEIPGSPFQLEIEQGTMAPRAEYDDVWTWMNSPVTFNVLTNDYVQNGSPIFVKIDIPHHGVMNVGRDGTMVYTPGKDYTGIQYLTYEMKDEAGEIVFGQVSITVVPRGQPYISAFPRVLTALENEPLPGTGGIANVEVASLEPDEVLSAELFALHGRFYPAAEMSDLWSNVSVIIPIDVSAPAENFPGNVSLEEPSDKVGVHLPLSDDITKTNDDSKALRFSANLESMNAALKAIQYMGIENFNGNDTVYFTVLNSAGVGSTKSMSVYVRAVNDPPFVVGPSDIAVNLSQETPGVDPTESGVQITGLSVGDPDADDKTGFLTYSLAGLLQLESGQFRITIPPSGYTSASYRAPGEKNWSTLPEQQISVWAQGVRFKASIFDWNTALQTLVLKIDNATSQRTELSLVIDDLGQFGCAGDCSSRDPYSYVIQHRTAIMIYEKGYTPPYKLKAFVKYLLYAMGGIVGLLGVFYLAGKRGRRFSFPWGRSRGANLELEGNEENDKMIRVYNPLWLATHQKTETTAGLEPTGTGFEVQQDWKMETMVPHETGPPLGNESMPLDSSPWGVNANSHLQLQLMDASHGGIRARKFSVKWSADAGVRVSIFASRTQNGPRALDFGGNQPLESPLASPPSAAFAGASFGQEVGGDAAVAALPPPPPGAGSFLAAEPPVSAEKSFTGFGDDDDEDPFLNAFSGFGESNPPDSPALTSNPPDPPTIIPSGASFVYGEKPFSGFGDDDDEEEPPPEAGPPPPPPDVSW